MENYTRSQLQEIYKKLPKELKEALFSKDSADDIQGICGKSGIKDEDKVREVAKYVGYVLLGILAPSNFQNALQSEVKLEPDVAREIASEIDRVLFYPLRESLAPLYPEEISGIGPPKIVRRTKSTMQKKADKYRESIE